MRRTLFVSALVLGLFSALVAFANQGPLLGNVEAVRVVLADNGKEHFLPAEKAHPQDVIEYRLTYTNNGQSPLKNISVTDPIPSGTEYIVRSATRPRAGDVEFSIDGGESYHAWPVLYKKTTESGEEIWVEATPDMITHIRWTIAESFEPESEITFSYRAIVK